MGKSQKPRKKYVPKHVRHPQIVVSHYSFVALHTALNLLLKEGVCEVDDADNLVYTDSAGRIRLVSSSLRVYIDYAAAVAQTKNLSISFPAMEQLMNNNWGVSELNAQLLLDVKKELEVSQHLVSRVSAKESIEILKRLRAQDAEATEKLQEKYLSNLEHMPMDRRQFLEFLEIFDAHFNLSRSDYIVGGDGALLLYNVIPQATRIDLYFPSTERLQSVLEKEAWELREVEGYMMHKQKKYWLHYRQPYACTEPVGTQQVGDTNVFTLNTLLHSKVHPKYRLSQNTVKRAQEIEKEQWTEALYRRLEEVLS